MVGCSFKRELLIWYYKRSTQKNQAKKFLSSAYAYLHTISKNKNIKFLSSTENVDLVGRRERFLKSNFESLSGADDLQSNNSNNQNTMSISNRYRESGSSAVQRNAATIARAQSFRDNEQNKRRELLQKRIEETRKKLQEVSIQNCR